MPRRKRKIATRDIGVDPLYGSHVMQKLINMMMRRGKKDVARAIVYDALAMIAKKVGGDSKKAFGIFEKAIRQVRPYVEVKSRRVGGGVYQVPTEVRENRSLSLALRWIIDASAKRSDKTMQSRLANELFEAADGHGNAMKKRNDIHRMAEANRAFSHYAW